MHQGSSNLLDDELLDNDQNQGMDHLRVGSKIIDVNVSKAVMKLI